MAIIPTYGATYIVSATDHSLDAIRDRLTPLAQSAGYHSVSLRAHCGLAGTSYAAYAHYADPSKCVELVTDYGSEPPMTTAADLEDKASAALYATIGQKTGSL